MLFKFHLAWHPAFGSLFVHFLSSLSDHIPVYGFHHIDHFSKSYVIEYAENEEDARLGIFEDTDLFDDSLEEKELIRQIHAWFDEYVLTDSGAASFDHVGGVTL